MKQVSLRKSPGIDHIASIPPARDRAGGTRMEAISMTSAALAHVSAHVSRYLSNAEAAEFLKLSPRTLEKQRVLGGGPKFRKFGRRVVYAIEDLNSWANARICSSTSDIPQRSNSR